MLLTVWRHGETLVAGTDNERPLTPRGRGDIIAGAAGYGEWMKLAGCPPVASIWSSSTRRTEETAASLFAELATTRIGVDEALAPGAIPEDFPEFDVLCLEQGGVSALSHCPDPQKQQPDRYA